MPFFHARKIYTVFAFLLMAVNFCLVLLVADNKVSAVVNPWGVYPRPQMVIVDAGHGGVDGGAVGYSGSIEKHINLQIALKLQDCLLAKGYEVLMIRDTDKSIHDDNANTIRQKKKTDLHNRLKIANEHPDAIYISIHQNIGDSSSYKGAMVYYSPNNPGSKELGTRIRESIIKSLQPNNKRELKEAKSNLFIMYNAKPVAVLVECGFISNPEEEKLLKTESYQKQMAEAITRGIEEYIASRQS